MKPKPAGAAVKTEAQDPAPRPAPAPAGGAEVKPEVKPEAAAAPLTVEPSGAGGAGAGASTATPRVLLPTGDNTRDQCRLKLKECFEKGIATNIKMLHEFDSNPAGMANECEHEMFEKLCGGSLPVSKEYKARFRSLMFNLKDEKNPDFILSVVMGAVHVNDLATMDVKEMASSEAKKQREKWRENAKMALMDEKSYNNYTGKVAQDGILRCPKCKSWKTEYFEVQTRSADEPTTKKCFCNAVRRRPPPAARRRAPPPAARRPPPTTDGPPLARAQCNYRWKFC